MRKKWSVPPARTDPLKISTWDLHCPWFRLQDPSKLSSRIPAQLSPPTLTTLFLFTNQQKVPGTFLRSNPPHLSCLLIMPHNLITRIYKNSCFEHLSLRVRRKKPYLFACCYSIRYRVVSYIHIKSLPLLICSLFY